MIHCLNRRCETCPEKSDYGCLKLRNIKESGGKKSQVMLAEAKRGLIHFCKLSELKETEPPWRSEDWETVFIGVNNHLFEVLEEVISIYTVGAYLSIFKRGEYNQTEFITVPLVKTSLEHSLIVDLSHTSIPIGDGMSSFREGITQKLKQSTEDISKYIMNLIPEINFVRRLALSEIIAHRRSVLGPIIPIILDDLVEEIFFDSPETTIYFDHQKYGRCITNITFQEQEISRIITLIRAESNLHLDRSNPSLKTDLQIYNASMRFSMSVPPLSPDGLHLEIRRAKNSAFSVHDLIENETMSPEVAAILLFAVSCRFNITITGGPGAGKTTLLNALDMTTPKWWRKIYIEDAIESRKQKDTHQIRFRVNPIDEQSTKFSKSDEIVKCLHRSPDYLILGEIQTAEHSKALFQAITAGLRTIQTCHGESASGLVSRWKLGHEVQNDNLALMDIIVTLERPTPGKSKRRVSEIVEIKRRVVNGILEFSGLNKVYDYNQGVKDNWFHDGAFMTRARDLGFESHIPALNTLIDIIRDNEYPSNLEMLSEEMWSYGHPMRFAEREI